MQRSSKINFFANILDFWLFRRFNDEIAGLELCLSLRAFER